MARRPRPGEWAIIFAEVPPEVKARLEQSAAENERSATAELVYLIKKHTPPLKDGVPAKPKRGHK